MLLYKDLLEEIVVNMLQYQHMQDNRFCNLKGHVW